MQLHPKHAWLRTKLDPMHTFLGGGGRIALFNLLLSKHTKAGSVNQFIRFFNWLIH